jgi:hypothetical protein
MYLPELDNLVLANIKERLGKIPCVSLSADGWRDRRRRDWIDTSIYFIEEPSQYVWKIEVLHPDLIPITSTSTSEEISGLIATCIETFVRSLIPAFPSVDWRRLPQGVNDHRWRRQ